MPHYKFNSIMSCPGYHCLPGKIVEMPEDVAAPMLEAGYCERVKHSDDDFSAAQMPEPSASMVAERPENKVAKKRIATANITDPGKTPPVPMPPINKDGTPNEEAEEELEDLRDESEDSEGRKKRRKKGRKKGKKDKGSEDAAVEE